METPEDRKTRLTAQAAKMRAAQALKRTTQHTCPPSETDAQLTRLAHLLARHAPDNIAPIPVAMSLGADLQWTIDLHVRIAGDTEYELSEQSETFATAVRRAADRLTHQQDLRDRGARHAATFRIEV